MKSFKSLLSLSIALSLVLLMNCGKDDEIQIATVEFESSTFDANGVSLEDVIVTIVLEPAAGSESTIMIDFSGATPGTAFTTTPASSGSSLELPVAKGDESVSFTVSFNRSALPENNLVISMTLGALGSNLSLGTNTSANINVPFVIVNSIPYAQDFGGTGSDCETITFPPEGWIVETVTGDAEGLGTWSCIAGPEEAFVYTGTGVQANAFIPKEEIEAWLISPVLGPMTSTSTLSVGLDLRFDPLGEFAYDVDVLISTDYSGLNLETATWERFQAGYNAWYSNDFELDNLTIYDGLDLSSYEGQAITIAFVYICPSSEGICGIGRVDEFSITN